MSGECVISSVLSHHSKDLKWRTSVTAQLQLRVLFGKQRKVHPLCTLCVTGGRPQRRGLNPSWLPLFIRLSPPLLEPALCKLGQPGELFVSPELLTQKKVDFLLFHFCGLFSFFIFQPLPFWTPFSYSNYLIAPRTKAYSLKELQELVNCIGRILGTSEDKFIDMDDLIQDWGITVLAEHLGMVLIIYSVGCWKPGLSSGL